MLLEGWHLAFFFQAGDDIRDRNVTGVQTCALPIWGRVRGVRRVPYERDRQGAPQRGERRELSLVRTERDEPPERVPACRADRTRKTDHVLAAQIRRAACRERRWRSARRRGENRLRW